MITTNSITIVSPEFIEVEMDLTDVTCTGNADGSIMVNAIGGSGSYAYNISSRDPEDFQSSNIFQNLSAGTYVIVIQDEFGCFVNSVVEILDPEPIVINTVSILPTGNFPSRNIEVSAIGGNGDYSYSINDFEFVASNQFYDLTAGIYDLTALDSNGCMSSPFTVTIVTLNIDNSIIESINGGLSANYIGATSYQWINVDTGTRITGAISIDFVPTEGGRYQVEITVSEGLRVSGKGLNSSTDQVVLSPIIEYKAGTLGVNDIGSTSFNIYPNPSIDFIILPTYLTQKKYQIFTSTGLEVSSGVLKEKELSVINLANGIYFLKVDGYDAVKFIKNY